MKYLEKIEKINTKSFHKLEIINKIEMQSFQDMNIKGFVERYVYDQNVLNTFTFAIIFVLLYSTTTSIVFAILFTFIFTTTDGFSYIKKTIVSKLRLYLKKPENKHNVTFFNRNTPFEQKDIPLYGVSQSEFTNVKMYNFARQLNAHGVNYDFHDNDNSIVYILNKDDKKMIEIKLIDSNCIFKYMNSDLDHIKDSIENIQFEELLFSVKYFTNFKNISN
jgi:hypothetical protein